MTVPRAPGFDRVGQGFDPQGGLTVPGYTPKGEEVAQAQNQGQLFETDFSDMKAKQNLAMQDKFGGIAERTDTGKDFVVDRAYPPCYKLCCVNPTSASLLDWFDM